MSKTYAMTGWRIGWAVAPPAVAKFMGDLQSQETSNPCSVSQWAALEAITGPAGVGRRDAGQFTERRSYVLERVARLPGVTCVPPGRGVLRLHEHLGPLRPDLGGQRHHRLDRLLPGGAGVRPTWPW